MSPIAGLALVAALSLAAGGLWLWRQPGGNRVKAVLMLLAGIVIGFNGWLAGLPPPG